MLFKTARQTSPTVEALNSLRKQTIYFEGPFRTANGRLVIRLKDQVVLESELQDLIEAGQLNPAGVETLLRKLRVL